MALNLTEQQIDKFDDWKADYLTKINFMREVIKTSVQDKCEGNAFYLALGKLAEEIDAFEVEIDHASYGTLQLASEKKFFFYLSEYLNSIASWVERFQVSTTVGYVFRQKKLDVKEIFEI